jgi:signal peptidase I
MNNNRSNLAQTYNHIGDIVLNYFFVFIGYFIALLNNLGGLGWFLFKPINQFYPLDYEKFNNINGYGLIFLNVVIANAFAFFIATSINKKPLKNFYILIGALFLSYYISYFISFFVYILFELHMNLIWKKPYFSYFNSPVNYNKSWNYYGIIACIALLAFSLVITYNNFETGVVNGESMQNTLINGDRIIFDRSVKEYYRGDIITAINPKSNEKVIKRIVALAGEEIEIIGSKIIIKPKGEPEAKYLIESYLADQQYTFQESSYEQIYMPKLIVPENHYFVLGDNRINSIDSRDYGTVPRENIIGNAAVAFSRSNDSFRSLVSEYGWVGLERAKYKFIPVSPTEQDKNQKIRELRFEVKN